MKKKSQISRLFLMLFIPVTLINFSGCRKDGICIRGNGQPIIETRSTQAFHEVINNGSFEVHILPADYYEVQVDAESNLMAYIRTSVSGGRLFIETVGNRCINNTMTIIITVYTPFVDGIELNGSGFVSVYDLYLDDLNIRLTGSGQIIADADALSIKANISGSGSIDLSGIAETTDFSISGSGAINSFSLSQQQCFATISGSGNMYIRVSQLLDAYITGSGNIYYRGNPDVVQRITGSGRVIRQ
ncbi:MAG: hypothetical protein CVT92_02930 [Bacteroidetes bacterium HGW-Bacteroidetes-1]|jgi:hypothetical protein|nr:MAG: hypothetical protein CVT92_02930 [Bacteroidetes bacterium HGW-Bacteroidetes-1]